MVELSVEWHLDIFKMLVVIKLYAALFHALEGKKSSSGMLGY